MLGGHGLDFREALGAFGTLCALHVLGRHADLVKRLRPRVGEHLLFLLPIISLHELCECRGFGSGDARVFDDEDASVTQIVRHGVALLAVRIACFQKLGQIEHRDWFFGKCLLPPAFHIPDGRNGDCRSRDGGSGHADSSRRGYHR